MTGPDQVPEHLRPIEPGEERQPTTRAEHDEHPPPSAVDIRDLPRPYSETHERPPLPG